MKALTLLTLALLVSMPQITKAEDRRHHRPHKPQRQESCIVEDWKKIKEETTNLDKCQEVSPLKLRETVMTFPLINVGPLKVRYWQASFVRSTKLVETYEHFYVNVCSGVKTYSQEVKYETVNTIRFDLQNPNLDPEISESFKLAPMTNAEAAKAYEALKTECEFVQN